MILRRMDGTEIKEASLGSPCFVNVCPVPLQFKRKPVILPWGTFFLIVRADSSGLGRKAVLFPPNPTPLALSG